MTRRRRASSKPPAQPGRWPGRGSKLTTRSAAGLAGAGVAGAGDGLAAGAGVAAAGSRRRKRRAATALNGMLEHVDDGDHRERQPRVDDEARR